MSRPFDTRPGGRLDAAFRQAPELTEADIAATLPDGDHLMPQSCRTCRWWSPVANRSVGYCEPALPFWVTGVTGVPRMEPDEGQSCPTWEPRAPDTETDR